MSLSVCILDVVGAFRVFLSFPFSTEKLLSVSEFLWLDNCRSEEGVVIGRKGVDYWTISKSVCSSQKLAVQPTSQPNSAAKVCNRTWHKCDRNRTRHYWTYIFVDGHRLGGRWQIFCYTLMGNLCEGAENCGKTEAYVETIPMFDWNPFAWCYIMWISYYVLFMLLRLNSAVQVAFWHVYEFVDLIQN